MLAGSRATQWNRMSESDDGAESIYVSFGVSKSSLKTNADSGPTAFLFYCLQSTAARYYMRKTLLDVHTFFEPGQGMLPLNISKENRRFRQSCDSNTTARPEVLRSSRGVVKYR